MGMYFKPLLIFPFSTIETIKEEKNDIIDKATIEKFLKWSGFTTTSAIENGKFPTLAVATDNLETKLRITIKR